MYWLSESFLTLFETSRDKKDPMAREARASADVVIVGSGYGGSVAAEKLALHLQGQVRSVAGRPEEKVRILVLERGKEFLPGEFPEDVSEVPSQIRINGARRGMDMGYADSLIQVYPADERSDSSVSVIAGSALGGGSQINAGVTRRPHPSVFENPRWPVQLRGERSQCLYPHFDAVTRGLDARPLPARFTPRKLAALERLHTQLYQPAGLPEGYRADFERPPIAVNYEDFKDGVNPDGVRQPVCINCGNCASGCNTGAKNTLTANYLPRARSAGAELYTEALVARISRDDESGRFLLEVHPTSSIDAADRDHTLIIDAAIVILAAGSMGSTEILLRSDSLHDKLSDRLGECFSTNGDSISARYKAHEPALAIGKGLAAKDMAEDRLPGPTITGAILLVPDGKRQGADGLPLPTFTVEDCAIPLPLAEVGAELVTSASMLRMMTQRPLKPGEDKNTDPLGNDAHAIEHTSFYLSMARDTASGSIVLSEPSHHGALRHARVRWPVSNPPEKEVPQNGHNLRQLDDILAGPAQLGGYYVPNPAREPVPPAIGSMMSHMPQGSSLTVHPLGGCAMGDDADLGVVDFRGRVFDRTTGGVLPGLYVMDGAVIPCAVETNPFLTIAGLADLATEQLIAIDLPGLLPGLSARACGPATPGEGQQQHGLTRPTPRLPPAPLIHRLAPAPVATRFKFKERLRQKLPSAEGLQEVFDLSAIDPGDFPLGLIYLELSLEYEPADLGDFLASPAHECSLSGHMRVVRRRLSFPAFADEDWLACTEAVPISTGTIHLFRSTARPSLRQFLRVKGIFGRRRGNREAALDGKKLIASALKFGKPATINFLVHLGASREVAYDFATRSRDGKTLHWRGRKNIQYRDDSNVWNDLFTLPLSMSRSAAPTLAPLWQGRLAVDVDYFLGEGVPSVQTQQTLPHSLMALSSYAMLYFRVILHTYFYEFGPPDYPAQAPQAMPLPGPLQTLEGVVVPQKYWLPVAEYARIQGGHQEHPVPADGGPEKPRDTGRRFEKKLRELRPHAHAPASSEYCLVSAYRTARARPLSSVLLIHGYAISSSMWASSRICEDNDALYDKNSSKNMVQSLLDAGHDVYVADLRTSSALPEIRNEAIGYDEVASGDIPCAIEFVWQQHGLRVAGDTHQINLVAHCMGSAQTSMALLSQQQSADEDKAWGEAHRRFEMSKQRIGKACFFQVAPLMAVTRANAVRGRAAAVFDALVGKQTVSPWLKSGDRTTTLEALLDRFAMTFPYPEGRDPGGPDPLTGSPWVGTTRKAFWLYGETWDNAQLGESTRRHIEEFIGPVNLGTYRQVGAFARCGRLVNDVGLNDYVKDRYLARTFESFDSLWLHGERSGMFEKQTTAGTVARLKTLLKASGKDHRMQFRSLPGFGHLDSLIGKHAHRHGHRLVVEFLACDNTRLDAGGLARQTAELAPYLASWRPPQGTGQAVFEHAAPESTDTGVVLGACSGGPFFSRTVNDLIRLWFFLETPLGNIPECAQVAITRKSRDAWSVVAGWDLRRARSFAALRQFAIELPASALQPGDRLVVASVMSESLDDLSMPAPASFASRDISAEPGSALPEPLDSQALSRLRTRLASLFAAGSYVEPIAAPPAARAGATGATGAPEANSKTGSGPDIGGTAREFWLGSCRYPGWMIDKDYALGAHTHWLAQARQHPPEALVLVGDQVYLDAMGNVIGDAPKADLMARGYLEAFGGRTPKQAPWLQLLRQTSLHCMMDDHELTDNYSISSSLPEASRNLAFEAFALFQGPSLPTYRIGHGYKHSGLRNGPEARLSGPGVLCGCPVYYLDARYHRSRKNGDLFSKAEFEAFATWARVVDKHLPKFIVTGSVLMPVLAATLAQPAATVDDDTLNGYPRARNALLEVIVREGLRNIVFLSGDLHLSCHGRGHFDTPGGSLPFAFCVSSGLYSPMPFANSRTWDLPEPHREHRLLIAGPGLNAMNFTIDGVTEAQSIARIAVERKAGGPEVSVECMGATAQALLKGKLISN